jgi:phage shock protein A/DNA-binding XRE family transcriptional regulator
MGYQLRMHNQIRGWLTDLRETEPQQARLVGEAVLALLDAGEGLGPPLVVPLESALRPPDDPREALDLSYERQLELLTKVRRGVATVATSRKRVELQASELERRAARLASQREAALNDGREDLAGEARTHEAGVQEQLSELQRQFLILADEEEKLTAASQRLQAKVDAFRIRKETFKATYTAAEASQWVREEFADIDADASDLDAADAAADAEAADAEAADASPGFGDAATRGNEPAEIRELTPLPHSSSGPAGQDDIHPPPGMMELRPGAPGSLRAGLLFAVEPEDTAVLLAWVADPGGSPGDYQEVIRTAAARLVTGQSADPPAGTDSAAAFVSYDAESFLDEFFPGEEAEVEIGAGVLVARNRAHTLAEARQRMRLTQAQVAERMNVRQERVSAIERAEPGATEVRTLAAYVRALGGRLEIIADIGDERITLR